MKIVLAVSQAYQENSVCDGSSPRTDFAALAESIGAIIVSQLRPSGALARSIEDFTALDIAQAKHVLRRHPDANAYVSFSERIGIPLGIMLGRKKQRPAHLMIAHRLNTRAKQLLGTALKWPLGVDRIVTLCNTQHRYAEVFAPGRSACLRVGVTDEQFYYPSDAAQEDFVLSVGSENRDYECLVAAIRRTDLHLKILSSSPWCRKKNELGSASSQVEFLPRVSYTDLRELYRKAKTVVVPLNDVDYAAGHNGITEAFCVGKPLIVSGSRGIAEYVSHLENGYVVPPADVEAMEAALRAVSTDAGLAADLKRGAARAVEDFANLDAYCKMLREEISRTCEQVRSAV